MDPAIVRFNSFVRFAFVLLSGASACRGSAALMDVVRSKSEQELPAALELYKHFHQHPELSFREKETSARLASELERSGYSVTREVGTNGVVAMLKNGAGRVVLVRTDMDALPVREDTGLPYPSRVVTRQNGNEEVPVMHACGHDLHMACLVAVARVLASLTNDWKGTVVLIGQPAEEVGSGARSMLRGGLFSIFPRPDYCLALHDSAEYPAGTIEYTPGASMANVDSIDILVRGIGGHGAYPHETKDPIVLASEIVIALQTIVSREVKPGEAAVVTVGSIHGGAKHNIIPNEVRLQITVRSYTDEIRSQILESIRRIARAQALSAGIPEDKMPVVTLKEDDFTPALFNDPKLTAHIVSVFTNWFGIDKVIQKKPSMGGEDFSEYGRVAPKIPVFMFDIGGVDPEKYAEAQKTGASLPSLHSPFWAPLPEPTLRTGIVAMSAAVLDLMKTQP